MGWHWRYNPKQRPEATYTLSKYAKELLKKFNMLIRHRRREHLQKEANRQNLQRARIPAQNHISGRMWEDSTRAKLLRVELNLHPARRKQLSFWWRKPMPDQKMECHQKSNQALMKNTIWGRKWDSLIKVNKTPLKTSDRIWDALRNANARRKRASSEVGHLLKKFSDPQANANMPHQKQILWSISLRIITQIRFLQIWR